MKTQTILYDDGSVKAEIVVAKATYDRAFDWTELYERARLQLAAAKESAEAKAAAIALTLMPSLECGTVSVDLVIDSETKAVTRPLQMAAIVDLPNDLIDEWLTGVLALNPKWAFQLPSKETVEKKASTSTPALDAGTPAATPSSD